MEIRKEGGLRGAGAPDEARLAKINAYARTPLTAEAVYCFRVRLCDDRPDRDFERFDTAALPRMAELFRGKTGICDHQWSADRQVARIFDTQVVREDDGASCLMAEAYALRTERNADLIADIEGGIKKEVSVGCAMGQARCSICGEPYGTCAHRKGAVYDGETCLAVLSEPLDAYEFSFVAVPAQRAAGVTKAGKEGYGMTLQDCVAKHGSPELSDALRRLSAEAELGRAWRKQKFGPSGPHGQNRNMKGESGNGNFSSGAGSGLHDDVSAGQRSGQHGVQDARQRYRRGLRGGQ